MSQIKEPEELVQWLNNNIILPYVQEVRRLTDSQDADMKELVTGVVDMMRQKFTSDISLGYIF